MKISVYLLLLLSFNVFSQDYVHQVLILNEGYVNFSNSEIEIPVTVGAYNPITEVYTVVDTIEGARFASDILIDGDFFYVAADVTLLKYDINTYDLLYSQELTGIRKLALVGDKIYATRGEYLQDFDSYLYVFSSEDLSFINSFDNTNGPGFASEGMVVVDDKVYIAVNNGFESGNETSIIGVIDATTNSYENEIDLGSEGVNPDNIMTDGSYLYTINNHNYDPLTYSYTNSSISKIDIASLGVVNTNLTSINSGCGTSCFREGKINYQVAYGSDLFEWDPNDATSDGESLNFSQNFYGLAVDPVNEFLYASSTNYTSYGIVQVYDSSNNLVADFDCGVSPGNMAFDVRNLSWDCNDNFACIELSDGSGNYQSLDDCEANCSLVEPTWDCNDNFACIELSDGTGVFSTLNDCEQECQNESSISETLIDLNIYPNPSSNIFNLEFYSDTKSEILVTNVLGEQVYIESTKSIGEFKTQIDLSNYSKGIYNLTIKTSDGTSNHKLILQ
tara:strand:+ start:419 stop:1933 length:1515 start_codon:yes stop_codon:yes gene_type:complete